MINKSATKNFSNKQTRSKKSTTIKKTFLTFGIISLLLFSAPMILFSPKVFAQEPSLISILNEMGFYDITNSNVETKLSH